MSRRTIMILAGAVSVVATAALLAPSVLAGRELSRGGAILRAQPGSGYLLRGQSDTHVVVTVTAPELVGQRPRPAMAVTVVLDRSGSMEGAPLADAKLAAHRLIDQLEARDQFSIVVYSGEARIASPMVAATGDGKAAGHAAVEEIHADGGTNISAGLDLGAMVARSAGAVALRRIVLISDGRANAGIHHLEGLADLSARIADGGVAITSIGVGLEFEERTMAAIAIAGNGRYYYVEDTTQLADLLDREIGGMADTALASPELMIRPASGVEIIDVYGYRTRREPSGALRISMPDLRSGETRKLVALVRAVAPTTGAMELATMDLAWQSSDGKRVGHAAATAGVRITDDAALVARSRDHRVVADIEESETASAIEQASTAYERGDYQQAMAIVNRRKNEAEANARALGVALDKLAPKAASGIGKAGVFAAPPVDEESSKRVLKENRADAYQLRY